MTPDWYRDEVIPGKVEVEVLARTPHTMAELLGTLQAVAAQVIEQHGGCQVFTNLGSEQHNKHLHWHVALGEGIARFMTRP